MSNRADRNRNSRQSTSPTIRRICRLRTRYHRETSGFFFVEGVRFVVQALDCGAAIERLITCRKLLKNPLGQKIARTKKREGMQVERVSVDEYLSITTSSEPQGIGAIVRQHWTALDQLEPNSGLCRVALHSVRSPGNLGTIIRTCDAVGAAGLILVGSQVDPFGPAIVRASMGSLFNIRLTRTSPNVFQDWIDRTDAHVIGTSPTAVKRFDLSDYRRPTILFLGDERKGLGEQELEFCEEVVHIPMVGNADSLNLGVAASLMLYEVFRQQHPE